jgi:hypothetical protein
VGTIELESVEGLGVVLVETMNHKGRQQVCKIDSAGATGRHCGN